MFWNKKKTVNIYAIHQNGKYYIGKSNDVDRRWKEHGKVDMEIIDCVPEDKWKETEIYWISQYRMVYGEENVLNQTDGGEGGPGFNSGEDHPNSLHSDDIVEQIKELGRQGMKQKDIAKKIGASRGYISDVLSGKQRGDEPVVKGYMKYPEFIAILRDYHDNGLDVKALMKKYGRKRLAIRRALQQYHFQTDLYEPLKKQKYTKRSWSTSSG